MSTFVGILQTDLSPETLASNDWHRYIDATDPDGLWPLSTRLFLAAQEREAEGIQPEAELLRLLSSAASMRLTLGGKPVFQPMAIFFQENKRSRALEDFDARDVAALSALAETVPTALLRARLGDVAVTAAVDLGVKEWRGGVIAAKAYLELAEQHLLEAEGIRVLPEFVRGLTLAWVYCRKDEALRERYWSLAEKAIVQSLNSAAPGIAFTLAEEVRTGRWELIPRVATAFETAAARYLDQGDPETAARCFDCASELWSRIAKRDEARSSQMRRGEALVARATSGFGMAMVRATWLAQGIEVLRRASADPARIAELRQELDKQQRLSLSDFKRFEISTDITEIVQKVQAAITGPTFFEALLQVAFDIGRWPNSDQIRTAVINIAQQSPLSSLFESTLVNADGATVARQKPFDTADPESVYQAMVKHCRDFDLTFRERAQVSPCVDMLFTGYHPGVSHVLEIVQASPMVPPSHERSLARGLFAGIERDWLEAATYLIPQVEPFIRHQFRKRGILTLALRDDGTQSEKSLTELLASKEAESILGTDLILELDSLMVHPLGYSLRHKWAHGLADDRQVINPGVLGLWWTMWRLILWPWGVERNRAKQEAQKPAHQNKV